MITVNELAKITHVSTRTLRYYDKIGLLTPAEISESGYRLYNEKSLEILRQILFYKSLNFSLDRIKKIVTFSNIDKREGLNAQKKLLMLERDKLNNLIKIINKALKGDDIVFFAEYNNAINEARKNALEIYEKAALQYEKTNPKYHEISKTAAEKLKDLQSNEKIESLVEKYYGGDAVKYAEQMRKELDPEFKKREIENEKDLVQEIIKHQNQGAKSQIVQSLVKKYHEYYTEVTGMTSEGSLQFLKEFYEGIINPDEPGVKEALETFNNLYGDNWNPIFLGEAINHYSLSK